MQVSDLLLATKGHFWGEIILFTFVLISHAFILRFDAGWQVFVRSQTFSFGIIYRKNDINYKWAGLIMVETKQGYVQVYMLSCHLKSTETVCTCWRLSEKINHFRLTLYVYITQFIISAIDMSMALHLTEYWMGQHQLLDTFNKCQSKISTRYWETRNCHCNG